MNVYYSDKHSKRARDMHLLKQLKLLLRDHVAENGMSSKERVLVAYIAYFAYLIYVIYMGVRVAEWLSHSAVLQELPGSNPSATESVGQ